MCSLSRRTARNVVRYLAQAMHEHVHMISALNREWQDLARAPAGHRFAQLCERQRSHRSPLARSLLPFAGLLALILGVTLTWVVLPALLFLPLAALLFATTSPGVARALDGLETFVRRGRRLHPAAREPEPSEVDVLHIPPSSRTRVRERMNSHRLAMEAARAFQHEQQQSAPPVAPSVPPLATPPAHEPRAVAVVATVEPRAHHASEQAVFERAHQQYRPRAARNIPATLKLGSWQAEQQGATLPTAEVPQPRAGLVKASTTDREVRLAEHALDATALQPLVTICPPPVRAGERQDA